jgi:hypothetical protein
MTKIRAGLVTLLSFFLIGVPYATADAATRYYWDDTVAEYGDTKVLLCSGGSFWLYEGQHTSKNVCSAWLSPEHNLYVYVNETGTELLDAVNCNTTGRWITLNSARDTSRTAMVTNTRVNCA